MISNERNFSLAINGERTCGQEIRNQNVTAVMSIANVVKSSLGPVGLDKMLVDNIGVKNLVFIYDFFIKHLLFRMLLYQMMVLQF